MLGVAKPRICIVNPFEHGGGAEYQIEQLIDALVRSDEYEIHYLTHFVDERARNRTYQVSRIGNGGPIPRFGYLMEAPSLYRKLRQIDPCIIYQRVACAYTGICAFYSQRHATPLVWHVAHDTEVTPHLLDKGRNVVRLRVEKLAVEYGVKHATRIVVQTRHQAHLLQKNYARAADTVVPNFHPPVAETLDKSGPLTVIWIANLKPWKQPEVFVRLANSLSSYSEVRFVIVGAPAPISGNERWRQALMQGIQNTSNLEYVGQKSHAQVNELLACAHIFVNTSVHEGFPNTFIQAWLRDVVVVSLQVDPDHLLEHRGVGIIAHSEAGLVSAVRKLIDSPDARAAYQERGRAHAIERHSLRNADDLVGLLRTYRRELSR
jgi:glycosyltransferase involved in cell wall biosynthesis